MYEKVYFKLIKIDCFLRLYRNYNFFFLIVTARPADSNNTSNNECIYHKNIMLRVDRIDVK